LGFFLLKYFIIGNIWKSKIKKFIHKLNKKNTVMSHLNNTWHSRGGGLRQCNQITKKGQPKYQLTISIYFYCKLVMYDHDGGRVSYCDLVKVRTLCILCNNWWLFRSRSTMPGLSLASFYTKLGSSFLARVR